MLETLIVDGPIGTVEGEVEHYPFDSLSQFIERHNGYSAIEARKILDTQCVLPERDIRYNLTVKPLKRFWKFYVKNTGYTAVLSTAVY